MSRITLHSLTKQFTSQDYGYMRMDMEWIWNGYMRMDSCLYKYPVTRSVKISLRSSEVYL